MEEELIYKRLNDDSNYVKEIFGEENLLGIFVFGECYQTEAIVIPNFESVCLNEPLINTFLHNKDHDIIIRDLRYAYHATRDGYLEMISSLYTDYILINPRYEHMFIKLLKAYRNEVDAGARSGIPAPELKNAIVKIMRCAFNDNSNTIKFIKQMTDAEKLALVGIIETIGDEGTFSQAKVASAIGISRLTMTNLVVKMEMNNVAIVQNMGPRGTYIKITDSAILGIKGVNTYA